MYVEVKIELTQSPSAAHHEEMLLAARSLTNDRHSVQVAVPNKSKNAIVAVFTIPKARQMDVVDRIGKGFHDVPDYSDSGIHFPKRPPAWYQPVVAKKMTTKQGQYLAFIYYYTKVNGRSPAERDIQIYFKVTPTAVHDMILKLEELGFISRVPRQARSIKLLVSRAEIPDLA